MSGVVSNRKLRKLFMFGSNMVRFVFWNNYFGDRMIDLERAEIGGRILVGRLIF